MRRVENMMDELSLSEKSEDAVGMGPRIEAFIRSGCLSSSWAAPSSEYGMLKSERGETLFIAAWRMQMTSEKRAHIQRVSYIGCMGSIASWLDRMSSTCAFYF